MHAYIIEHESFKSSSSVLSPFDLTSADQVCYYVFSFPTPSFLLPVASSLTHTHTPTLPFSRRVFFARLSARFLCSLERAKTKQNKRREEKRKEKKRRERRGGVTKPETNTFSY